MGSMAVPRNVKVRIERGTQCKPMSTTPLMLPHTSSTPYSLYQIDSAIYDNEVNLVKGAFKLHPRLVGKEAEGFVYGYNLKRFPDEPIKVGAAARAELVL